MKRLRGIAITVLAYSLLTGAAARNSRNTDVLIHSGDVTLRTDADTTCGRYYTVSYSPPDSLMIGELDRAILELYLEVRAKVRGEYVNEAPVLEVYALKEPFGSSLDPETLDKDRRCSRPVAVGANRRVAIDVTQILVAHLQGSIQNNGLVIGSVTGMREGDFLILSGRLPQGAVGRLHIHRRHPSTPAMTEHRRSN